MQPISEWAAAPVRRHPAKVSKNRLLMAFSLRPCMITDHSDSDLSTKLPTKMPLSVPTRHLRG